jgi:hypothetical protein
MRAGMRPGMQPLLELLRGRFQQSSLSDADFAALLDLVDEENVLPYIAERLRLASVEFTPSQKQQLDQIVRKSQLSSFVWTATLKSTLAAFHAAEVPVIALKGPCFAERVYGDAALRNCFDLDLLVRASDLARAEKVLTGLGFRPNSEADDYHRPWSRDSLNLELHHNVENPLAFPFGVEAAWTRAVLSQFQGVPVRLFAPSDELLYLCLHGVRHRFERLALYLDLALAFRRLPVANDTSARDDRVFDNVLAVGWMLASRLDPGLPAEPAITRTPPRDRKRLEQLAGSLWQELMISSPPTLDWAAQHSFYLEIESPGWSRFRRRLHHQRILLSRLIDADFAFAGRFHLHRNWQVRLLRPIRLLIKTLRPSPKML